MRANWTSSFVSLGVRPNQALARMRVDTARVSLREITSDTVRQAGAIVVGVAGAAGVLLRQRLGRRGRG